MSDYDYDAYQKELSIAAKKEEEQRWHKYMPIYVFIMLICFSFLLFFPFKIILAERAPASLCYILSCINLFMTIQIFQYIRKEKKNRK